MKFKEILKHKAAGRIPGSSRRLLDFPSSAEITFQLCVSVQKSEDIPMAFCWVNKLFLLLWQGGNFVQ